MYVCVCISVRACARVCVYVHLFVCVCVCVCVLICVHNIRMFNASRNPDALIYTNSTKFGWNVVTESVTVNVTMPDIVQRNKSSLFAHVFVCRKGVSPNPWALSNRVRVFVCVFCRVDVCVCVCESVCVCVFVFLCARMCVYVHVYVYVYVCVCT